jgi:hypothetical protein
MPVVYSFILLTERIARPGSARGGDARGEGNDTDANGKRV